MHHWECDGSMRSCSPWGAIVWTEFLRLSKGSCLERTVAKYSIDYLLLSLKLNVCFRTMLVSRSSLRSSRTTSTCFTATATESDVSHVPFQRLQARHVSSVLSQLTPTSAACPCWRCEVISDRRNVRQFCPSVCGVISDRRDVRQFCLSVCEVISDRRDVIQFCLSICEVGLSLTEKTWDSSVYLPVRFFQTDKTWCSSVSLPVR